MLDFGFSEILLTSAIALVVLGPERLPKVARQVGNWMGRARAMARQLSEQLEREVSADELLKEHTKSKPLANRIAPPPPMQPLLAQPLPMPPDSQTQPAENPHPAGTPAAAVPVSNGTVSHGSHVGASSREPVGAHVGTPHGDPVGAPDGAPDGVHVPDLHAIPPQAPTTLHDPSTPPNE